MLSTVGQILDFVNRNYRLTSTSLNTYVVQQIAENYNNYAGRMTWKQSIVEDYSTTTAQDVQYYEVPNDFYRIEENSVVYDTEGAQRISMPLPVITENQVGAWKSAGTSAYPAVCAIVGGGTNESGKRILLLPQPSAYSVTFQYDYVKRPTALASTTETLDIPELGYAVAWKTLSDVAVYENDFDRAKVYEGKARDEWKTSFQTISQG